MLRPDVVIHLAAETGTGQSLCLATRHARVNVVGTTEMLDAFSRHDFVPEQILLSSSRAVYGEGAWKRARDGSVFYPGQRSKRQLEAGLWDFPEAVALPQEASRTEPRPCNIYAATKLAQEHIVRAWALSYGASATVLRLQNVYGPLQSLSNPYTGIVSLFCREALAGQTINLYEDGKMTRDFVYIADVVAAFLAALSAEPQSTPLDIGSGSAATLAMLGQTIARIANAPEPIVSGKFRHGDVRHASCDVTAACASLRWQPKWCLEAGLDELCRWIARSSA
jgi:dTDP-L-rhamnose 4-epimerase